MTQLTPSAHFQAHRYRLTTSWVLDLAPGHGTAAVPGTRDRLSGTDALGEVARASGRGHSQHLACWLTFPAASTQQVSRVERRNGQMENKMGRLETIC